MLLSEKARYFSDFTEYKKKAALLDVYRLIYKSEHDHAKISPYFIFDQFANIIERVIIDADLYNTCRLPIVLSEVIGNHPFFPDIHDEVIEYAGSYLELMLIEHGWNVAYQGGTLMFR
jgi:hypothetical protein